MRLTKELLTEIESWLSIRGAKDTSFPKAKLPIEGSELLALVQEGKNVSVDAREFFNSLKAYIELDGYLFNGLITPDSTNTENINNNIYYIAVTKGTYVNFNNYEHDGTTIVIFYSKNIKDGVVTDWNIVNTNIRIDVADIANNALIIANAALEKTNNFEANLTLASERSEQAANISHEALEKAENAVNIANLAIPKSDRGIAGGIPILDNTGLIPRSMLPIKEVDLIDSYESERIDAAPTARAVNELYKYHELDIEKILTEISALSNLLQSSTEVGVAPQDIKVSSKEQSVTVRLLCSTDWAITEIPEFVTTATMSGNGNADIIFNFSVNPSQEDNRTGTIKIANSLDNEATITVTQYSATIEYIYEISVEPTSVDVSQYSGTGEYSVTSLKKAYLNDTPTGDQQAVDFTVSSNKSWCIPTKTGYTYDENILEAERSATITFTQAEVDSPKSTTFTLNQSKAEVRTEYTFSCNPNITEIRDNGLGQDVNLVITSTKRITTNNTSEESQQDYNVEYFGDITSEWCTYDKVRGILSIKSNNTDSQRVGNIKFTQVDSGKVITINIIQEKASISWSLVFEYTPTSIYFSRGGETKSYSITKCAKQKYINGVYSGEEVTISSYTTSVEGEGFSVNSVNSTVTATENNGEARTGKLLFYIDDPDITDIETKSTRALQKVGEIALSQEAGVITWVYNLSASVSEETLPAINASTVLSVTSTKQKYVNGNPEGDVFSVPFTCASTLLSGNNASNSTWTMQENKVAEARQGSITVTQTESGGKSTTVNVTQKAAIISYNYTLTVSPTSMSFPALGGSQSFTVTSVKQQIVNSHNEGSPQSVGYNSSVNNSHYSLSGNNITAPENTTTDNSWVGTLTVTQQESNKTATISLSQALGVETYGNYIFTVNGSSTNISQNFSNRGQTITFNVVSTRQRYINSKPVGSAISHGYSASVSGTGFSKTGDSGVTASANSDTSSGRSGTMIFTQNDSGKSITVSLTQPAASITYQLRAESLDSTSITLSNLNNSVTKNYKVYKDKYLNNSLQSSEELFLNDQYINLSIGSNLTNYVTTPPNKFLYGEIQLMLKAQITSSGIRDNVILTFTDPDGEASSTTLTYNVILEP